MVGLAEKRTGIICEGAQSGFSGNKRWEERQPLAAAALQQLAETHAQQEPSGASELNLRVNGNQLTPSILNFHLPVNASLSVVDIG